MQCSWKFKQEHPKWITIRFVSQTKWKEISWSARHKLNKELRRMKIPRKKGKLNPKKDIRGKKVTSKKLKDLMGLQFSWNARRNSDCFFTFLPHNIHYITCQRITKNFNTCTFRWIPITASRAIINWWGRKLPSQRLQAFLTFLQK